MNRKIIYLTVLGFVFNFTKLLAFDGDTAKTAKIPKHYFKTTFYADFYTPGKRTLDTVNTVSKKLKSYKISQLSLGFNVPVITKDIYNKDSTRISNMHLLLTGGYSNVALDFEGISKHNFSKTSLGMRGIYNNGKKSIFFAEISPFVTQDNGYNYTKTYRIAATVLYNCSVNESFSFRLGFTRSYLWGNSFNLPYIGVRVGKLDKVNFSVQFPRSVTFNIPMGKYVRTSLYTKSQGGLYTFANTDSIQLGSIYENKTLYFGRSEFLSGARIDIMPLTFFNLYLSTGFTTRNKIEFFPAKKRTDPLYGYNNNYKEKIKGSIFINVGCVFRFGKTRSIYNSQQMYNAIDLNNSIDPLDNSQNSGNGNIPVVPKKMGNIKADEVLDLIETQDLY